MDNLLEKVNGHGHHDYSVCNDINDNCSGAVSPLHSLGESKLNLGLVELLRLCNKVRKTGVLSECDIHV